MTRKVHGDLQWATLRMQRLKINRSQHLKNSFCVCAGRLHKCQVFVETMTNLSKLPAVTGEFYWHICIIHMLGQVWRYWPKVSGLFLRNFLTISLSYGATQPSAMHNLGICSLVIQTPENPNYIIIGRIGARFAIFKSDKHRMSGAHPRWPLNAD